MNEILFSSNLFHIFFEHIKIDLIFCKPKSFFFFKFLKTDLNFLPKNHLFLTQQKQHGFQTQTVQRTGEEKGSRFLKSDRGSIEVEP